MMPINNFATKHPLSKQQRPHKHVQIDKRNKNQSVNKNRATFNQVQIYLLCMYGYVWVVCVSCVCMRNIMVEQFVCLLA